MANSVAPDSWEQQADNGDIGPPQDKSIESKFSTLNVNAAEFVPSFCINSSPQNSNTADSSNNRESANLPKNRINNLVTGICPQYHGYV